jgi:predicted metal-dependent phosphoesterase TrpH
VSLWRADLHVHTVLSGCAEPEMIPPALVARAREVGLDLVGVVDHNAAGNAVAVVEAAGSNIMVLPGLEVETRESVHLLCLFDAPAPALEIQELVFAHLPPAGRIARAFGACRLAASDGSLVGEERRPLYMATDLSVEEVAREAHHRGALVLAAHAHRRAHGLLGVLGFVPAGLALDGLESGPGGLQPGFLCSSDAHRLSEIGTRYTVFEVETPSVEELRRAIAEGRFRPGLSL